MAFCSAREMVVVDLRLKAFVADWFVFFAKQCTANACMHYNVLYVIYEVWIYFRWLIHDEITRYRPTEAVFV